MEKNCSNDKYDLSKTMIKVIHLGKFDSPDRGGIENHVDSLCTALSKKKYTSLILFLIEGLHLRKKLKKILK